MIKKDDLDNLKALNSPPDPVRHVMSCVTVFKPIPGQEVGEADGWAGSRMVLSNPTLLINSLKAYAEKIGKVK
jgi:hypothetical protein